MPSSLTVLCPTAGPLEPFSDQTLPSLGDALIVDLARARYQGEKLLRAVRAAPWCAVCLHSKDPLPTEVFGPILAILPRHVAVLPGTTVLTPRTLTEALRRQPLPEPIDLLDYFRLRQLDRRLIAAVEDALGLPDSDSDSDSDSTKLARRTRSSVDRQVARFGPLRTAHWRALFRLLPILESSERSAERSAWSHGLDPRTLRGRVVQLIGRDASSALDCPGWEWKLEAALRTHRYLPWPRATRRRSAEVTTPVAALI